MNEYLDEKENRRNIWVRGLFMLLMSLAYQVCGTVLCIVSVFQFLMVLMNDTPAVRLVSFGRSLGYYLQQIANFLSFATEDMPFPVRDWPSGE